MHCLLDVWVLLWVAGVAALLCMACCESVAEAQGGLCVCECQSHSVSGTYIHTCYTCSYETQETQASHSLISRSKSHSTNQGVFHNKPEPTHKGETPPNPRRTAHMPQDEPSMLGAGKTPRGKKPISPHLVAEDTSKNKDASLWQRHEGQHGGAA